MYVFDILKTVFVLYLFVFVCLLSVYLSIYLSISFFVYVFEILEIVFVIYLLVFVCFLSMSVYSQSIYLPIRLFFPFLNLFLSFISLRLSVSYLCLFPRCQAACQSNSCAKIRHDLSLHMQATIILLFQINSKIILF